VSIALGGISIHLLLERTALTRSTILDHLRVWRRISIRRCEGSPFMWSRITRTRSRGGCHHVMPGRPLSYILHWTWGSPLRRNVYSETSYQQL